MSVFSWGDAPALEFAKQLAADELRVARSVCASLKDRCTWQLIRTELNTLEKRRADYQMYDRIQALHRIEILATRGDRLVLDTIISAVSNFDLLDCLFLGLDEYCAYLDALAYIALPGDQQAINVALSQLCHCQYHEEVIQAASATLRRFAAGASTQVFQGILALMEDPRPNVQYNSLRVLAIVAEKGDPKTIETLLSYIDNPIQEVREGVADALSDVSLKADSKVVASLITLLNDEATEVRASAAQTLSDVANIGDESVLLALTRRMSVGDDRCDPAREVCKDAICKLHEKGNRDSFKSILNNLPLEHEDHWVRRDAVQLLARITPEADSHHILRILAILCDENKDVRIIALRVLKQIVTKRDSMMIPTCVAELPCADNGEQAHKYTGMLQRHLAPVSEGVIMLS
jgi:HEAT repeat protein